MISLKYAAFWPAIPSAKLNIFLLFRVEEALSFWKLLAMIPYFVKVHIMVPNKPVQKEIQ